MSVAKFDPNTVTMTWGPILFVGFEGGEFITAELAVPQRYSRKQAFGRAIHTQSTDTGGTVTVRLQADSPTIALLSAQPKPELAVPQRYSRKQAFGRAIHTQSTDTGGTVTVRLQADSPTIALLSAQLKADLAPGGNVLLPLLVKDLSGLDVVISPLARCISIPTLAFSTDDPPPREFVFQCEPLEITHGGISSQNG